MPELITSADTAELLGVSTSTVKRWVSEGRLECLTTPGGHRRFSRSKIERFRGELGGQFDDVAGELLKLMLHDETTYGLQAKLIELRGSLGTWWQVADRIGEALVELGWRWRRGACGIAQEHIATRRLENALWSCLGSMPSPALGPCCLLASAEGDEHTLGLSLANMCLRERGRSCRWLGSPTPTRALVDAIHQFEPDIVAMSASAASCDADSLEKHFRSIEAACRRVGAVLVLGGEGAWPENATGAHRVRSFAQFAQLLDRHANGELASDL